MEEKKTSKNIGPNQIYAHSYKENILGDRILNHFNIQFIIKLKFSKITDTIFTFRINVRVRDLKIHIHTV